jgi:hypothetical protein
MGASLRRSRSLEPTTFAARRRMRRTGSADRFQRRFQSTRARGAQRPAPVTSEMTGPSTLRDSWPPSGRLMPRGPDGRCRAALDRTAPAPLMGSVSPVARTPRRPRSARHDSGDCRERSLTCAGVQQAGVDPRRPQAPTAQTGPRGRSPGGIARCEAEAGGIRTLGGPKRPQRFSAMKSIVALGGSGCGFRAAARSLRGGH